MGDRLDNPNKYHLCLRLRMCTCTRAPTFTHKLSAEHSDWQEWKVGQLTEVYRGIWSHDAGIFFINCGSQEPKTHNNPLFRQEGFRGDMMLSISLLTVQSSSVLRQVFSLQNTKKLVKDSHTDIFRGLKANSFCYCTKLIKYFFSFLQNIILDIMSEHLPVLPLPLKGHAGYIEWSVIWNYSHAHAPTVASLCSACCISNEVWTKCLFMGSMPLCRFAFVQQLYCAV